LYELVSGRPATDKGVRVAHYVAHKAKAARELRAVLADISALEEGQAPVHFPGEQLDALRDKLAKVDADLYGVPDMS
jgi:hypothetical protein